MERRNIRNALSLLHVDYVKLDSKWNYANVISPYYRMYLIDEGLGYIRSGKEEWLLEPGYMYIIPSFTICNLVCSGRLGQYFIHFLETTLEGRSLFDKDRKVVKVPADHLETALFKRILAINPNRKINRSDNPKVYEKNIFYKEYERLNNSQTEAVFLETQGVIFQLLAKFVAARQFHGYDNEHVPSKVGRLIDYIQLNMGEKLGVGELAKKVALHPDYLSRLFVKLTGQRPMTYIREKRIERAQYLMETSGLSLSKIAELTGFSSLPHFIKDFKKVTQLTPKQYRTQNAKMI